MNYNLKKKIVCFRVDSSLQIGSGHIERCITLSKQLIKKGMKIHFICRNHIGHMEKRIKQEGFDVTILPIKKSISNKLNINYKNKHKSWLGENWDVDAKETSEIILKKKPQWLIIDHYAIDIKWENLIKSLTGVKIMVIDGLANRHHNCEILLDHTYSQNNNLRWKSLFPSHCKLLSGPKHALLRQEFISEKKKLSKKTGKIKRILISFGGYDRINATKKTLEAIISLNKSDILIDVVVGNHFPYISQIQKLCNEFSYIKLHIQPLKIAKLMSLADLSIGAGGTMVWERCYLGLPALLISIADNQRRQAAAVHSYGALINLGFYKKNIDKVIIKELNKLFRDKKKILSMNRKCLNLMKISNLNFQINPTKFLCSMLLKNYKNK